MNKCSGMLAMCVAAFSCKRAGAIGQSPMRAFVLLKVGWGEPRAHLCLRPNDFQLEGDHFQLVGAQRVVPGQAAVAHGRRAGREHASRRQVLRACVSYHNYHALP